jgi:adenine deaminase
MILQTYINGELVAEEGKTNIECPVESEHASINHFNVNKKSIEEFEWPHDGNELLPVIEALDGQLITNKIMAAPKDGDGVVVGDVKNDILKIVVSNRYANAPIAKAWLRILD